MNYKVITEPFNKTFGTGRMMYLAPADIDETDLLLMQVHREPCICWILFDEGKNALDHMIKEMGITKTIVKMTSLFHQQMSNQIIDLYRKAGNEEKLVDNMLYDMDCFIYNTVSDHYEEYIKK